MLLKKFIIRELLLKTFIHVLMIYDNEDDIFLFSRNVRNPAPAVKKAVLKILIKNTILHSTIVGCNV